MVGFVPAESVPAVLETLERHQPARQGGSDFFAELEQGDRITVPGLSVQEQMEEDP